MLEIEKTIEDGKATVTLTGRLDTFTATELDQSLKESYEGLTELVFDFVNLEYISSAGLRVLLTAQKVMNKQGSMTLTNVSDIIMEVFEVTGFIDILTIE